MQSRPHLSLFASRQPTRSDFLALASCASCLVTDTKREVSRNVHSFKIHQPNIQIKRS